MTDTLEFIAEIDEFEPLPSFEEIQAEMVLFEGDLYPGEVHHMGGLSYPKKFLPKRGLFPAAKFQGALSLLMNEPETHVKSTPSTTRNVFEVELTKRLSKESYLHITDIGNGTIQGEIILRNTFLPEEIEEETDSRYVIIQLEYEHELTKKRTGRTDEEIDKRRETTHDLFSKWEERYF